MRRVMAALGSALSLAFAVACAALLAALFVGPALYVELAGAVAPGLVVAKHEVIQPKSESWSRRLTVDVRYRPAGADEDEVAQIAMGAAAFDQARVGATVRVRYLPDEGLLRQVGNVAGARLETQPPLGSFFARVSGLMPLLVGIALWLALLWAWNRWRRWWLALGVLGVMAGGAFLAGSGWQRPLPAGELLAGSATVRSATRIDRVWGGRRTPAEDAAQPFLVVELAFVPAGRADPVVAVDLVDDDSVPTLAAGATVPIHYSAADPRRAQIDGATRTYFWKNLRSFGLIALLLAALALGTWGWRAWRRSRAAQP